jgi:glutaconate CoA-transferase subunit B
MRVEAVHAGVTVNEVRAKTPFELGVADHVGTTAPPSEQELRILRALDPVRQFLG